MTVSVLIPAYNAAKTLGGTLRALQRQTRLPDEVIVCDDGSTDDTSQLAGNFPNVRVIRQENAGTFTARITLLNAAQCDVVMYCDADDLPHSDWIEHLVGRLESTGADISVAGLCSGIDLTEMRYVWPCSEEGVVSARKFYRLQLRHPSGVYSYLPSAAFRRERLVTGKRIRPVTGLQMHEDEVFMLAASKRCRLVAYSPKGVYDYIFLPGSLCDVYSRNRTADRKHRRQWYLRDSAKFRITGRPVFGLRALWHLIHGI